MDLCVLMQITLVFKPFVTEIAWIGPFITVAKPDVYFQSCQSGAGHVAERTFHLIHMLADMVS